MTTAKTFVGRVTVAEGLLSGSLFEGLDADPPVVAWAMKEGAGLVTPKARTDNE